jgi:hypothetical protein
MICALQTAEGGACNIALLTLQLRITVISAIHLALECRGAVGDVKELAHHDGPQKWM